MTMSRREMEFLIRFKADASQALNQIRTQLQGVGTTANKLNRATSTAGTQVAASMSNAAKSTKALNNHTQSLVGSMHALRGAVVSLGVASFSKALVKTSTDMDSLRAKLSFTFGANSGVVFQELSADADRLGIRLIDLADQFGSFAAAARATGLDAKTVKDTFIGVAEATKALKLPAEQTKGALFAIQQMMAKGKVNSEEFRLQLAERLPIAMLAATRATNKTAAEFTELLETGKLVSADFVPKFAKQLSLLSQASLSFSTQSLQSELSRATNVLDKFFIAVGDSGFKQGLTELLRSFREASPVVERLGKSFGEALGYVLDMARVVIEFLVQLDKMTGGLSTNALAIGVVATAVSALIPLLGIFTSGISGVVIGLVSFASKIGLVAVLASPLTVAVLAAVTAFVLLGEIVQNITGIDIIGDSFNYLATKLKEVTKDIINYTGAVDLSRKSTSRWDDDLSNTRQALIEMGVELPYITQYLKEIQSIGSNGSVSLFGSLFKDGFSGIEGKEQLAKLGLQRDALNNLYLGLQTDLDTLLKIKVEGKRIKDLSPDELLRNFDNLLLELSDLERKTGLVGIKAGILKQSMSILSSKLGDMFLAISQAKMDTNMAFGVGGSDTAALVAKVKKENDLLIELEKSFGAEGALKVFNSGQSNEIDVSNPRAAESVYKLTYYKDKLEKDTQDAENARREAASKLKQTADKTKKDIQDFYDVINSDQYDAIFMENMPNSQRMVAEAQKGLKDLEKIYADGAALGAKLDGKQMADREARFAAHRKHIEDIQKKSNQVMIQEQEQASKDTIEALRRNPEIASQAQAAIEQLRHDAEYKTGVMADYFLSAFDKATDALSDFVTTGKANISDFVAWAAKELAKIALTNIGTQIAGSSGVSKGLSTAGSFIKTLFLHSGGVVGAGGNATRMVDPSMFIGAPRFHSGLKPDEFPAILQRGETVIPRNQSASSFMGGGSISIPMSVNVNIAGGAGGSNGSSATTEDAQRIGAYVADTVSTRFYALLDKEQRPGGRLAGTRGGL